MMTYDCVVVGAGVSGLSAAYALRRQGVEVRLVEAADRVGGAIHSVQTADGYVLECGPNTVTSDDPLLWAHFVHLGIEGKSISADRSAARRFILFNGKPELIPMSPPGLIKTPLLSTASKLRMLAEPFMPRAVTPDESVATFFARRLGLEPAQRLVDPFVSGVYAGDPTATSMKAAFPSIWEAEQGYGSVVRGMIAGRKKTPRHEGPRPRSVLFNFQKGLATWPQAMAKTLGADRVWLNTRATELQPTDNGWNLTVERDGRTLLLESDMVVLATPAYVTADLVAGLDAEAARALRNIPYVPMAVVHLGYSREAVEHPLDGFGVLCPSSERRNVLGILWSSTLFPGRAPEGAVLTTSFIGGARAPELAIQDDETLIAMTVREHEAMLGARGTPLMTHIARWPHAICQYVAGHSERMTVLGRLEAAAPGLHLLGNYRDGVSVEKCWHSGKYLAERIVQRLPRYCSPVGA